MTVYWRRGGMRGGTGDRMVGVRSGTGEPYLGALRGCMAVLGCPPDPSNNSGRAWGHPLAPLTNWRDRACGHVHSLTPDHGLAVAVMRVVAARRWHWRGNSSTARRRSDKYAVASPL